MFNLIMIETEIHQELRKPLVMKLKDLHPIKIPDEIQRPKTEWQPSYDFEIPDFVPKQPAKPTG